MSKFRKLAFLAGLFGATLAAHAQDTAKKAEAAEGRVTNAALSTDAGAGGRLGLGRAATPEEVAAWDIDVRPDGQGLPVGKGTVSDGETIFAEQCASCHGDFGEGRDRWPQLAGGFDTLTRDRPVKTVGSYWPYLSTVYDYVHRAMPFGNARSLSNDDVYALTAYVLYLNDIETDEDFELSDANFTSVTMPNAGAFVPDDRAEEQHYKDDADPCMADCKPGPVTITMHAQVLDVTPEGGGDESGPAGGSVD
ncbi:cytochrome c [Aurantimonas sp. 22II-16-19i]|uniref:c-type cytochrome n=1 Tax=Aurantimonas sp. 22II-16-19i TaxID=1317114 RepID=UPI0009F7B25F|nr:cytochrome c [Aurantimonas sp. 22II-16-19i]ORE99204.1 sulfite oxidase cytochrome subunit [Aurantimonas sp. 22II-16-19i]